MEVNDTLKLKAFGWKKDMITKQPHIQKVIQNNQQYYPPDAHGVIDEWDALMRQQYDLMTKREQLQAQQDKERKKQYHDYLDWQTKEKQRQKALDEEKKRQELNELSNNQVQMQGIQHNRKEEGKTIKTMMAHEWINDMAKNKQQREQRRQKEIQEDLARIEQEKRQAQDNQLKDKEKKNQWLKEQEEMIQFKEYMKDKEKEKQAKDHESYLKACEERQRQKDAQDQRWNKYYRDFDAKLAEKQKDYEQKFVLPTKEKEARENEKIIQELQQAEKAKWDREFADQMHKKEVAKQIYDGNLERLGLKSYMQEKTKEKDKMFQEQKMLEAEAARQRELMEKDQQKNQKDMYKQTLMQQMNLKQQANKNYGKMTFQEKRLNRQDLDLYKNFDNSISALIPGINHINSIASRPLAKGALNQLYYGNTPYDKQKGHMWMQPSASAGQLPTFNTLQSQQNNQFASSSQGNNNIQTNAFFGGYPQQQQQQSSQYQAAENVQSNASKFFSGVPGATNLMQSQSINRAHSQSQILSKSQFENMRISSQTPAVQCLIF